MDVQNMVTGENQFVTYNNIQVMEADLDHAVMQHVISNTSLNPYGIVHGGVYFTMQDVAAGTVARMDGRHYVTLSSSNRFLKATEKGRLTATGHLVHRGRTVCTVNTEVRDEQGKLVADGAFTMYCLDPDKPMKKD